MGVPTRPWYPTPVVPVPLAPTNGVCTGRSLRVVPRQLTYTLSDTQGCQVGGRRSVVVSSDSRFCGLSVELGRDTTSPGSDSTTLFLRGCTSSTVSCASRQKVRATSGPVRSVSEVQNNEKVPCKTRHTTSDLTPEETPPSPYAWSRGHNSEPRVG